MTEKGDSEAKRGEEPCTTAYELRRCSSSLYTRRAERSESEAALKKKIAKYCLFAFLYSFLVFEITITSGLLDPRCLFWPSTPGHFTYMFTGGRFFACYGYQYQVRGKMLQGSQLLPLIYEDALKQKPLIRVHYNDANPEKSFFEPGFNPIVAFVVLFVIFVGIFLLFIPVLARLSASEKNKL